MAFKLRLTALGIVILAGLLGARPALAFPPLPSSFYGTVTVNGQDVPDGTVVRALIAGQAVAEGRTHTYQGHSVYNVDVKGDEAGTPQVEGGVEGAVVQFEVGGVLAAESGVWHSGTNAAVNLSVSGAGPLAAPPPTLTPVPSQTPILRDPATPTPEPAPAAAAGLGAGWLLAGLGAAAVVAGGAWLARRRWRRLR